MIRLRPHLRSPQRLAWLLALFLLLPLAQTVAAWHGLTHLGDASATDGSSAKHTAGDLKCDLCVTAIAIGIGALPSPALILAEPSASHHQTAYFRVVRAAVRTLHYRSRAPPISFA
jgi:hypothetical protein